MNDMKKLKISRSLYKKSRIKREFLKTIKIYHDA
jgi:hypothetical protein